jgi:hypothetical protein
MRGLLVVPLIALLILSGCAKTTGVPGLPSGTNTALAKVVQAESDVSAGVAAALQITTTLYSAGDLDKATASQIAAVLATITAANGQAIALTKGLVTISASQALTLQTLEAPITTALQNLVNSGLVGIKNANTKAAITASLSTLLVTLQIIQGTTGGS